MSRRTKAPAIVREFDAIFSEAAITSRSPQAACERLLQALKFPTAGRPGKALVEGRQNRIKLLAALRFTAPVGSRWGALAPVPMGLRPTQTDRERWQHHDTRQRLSTRDRALRHAAAWCLALGLLPKDADPQEQARERALRQFAIDVGASYHAHITHLYQSSRAAIVYGRGGQEESDNTIYRGAFKGWYARWQNAGVRVQGEQIVIESSRGTEKARIPLPTDAERARIRPDSAAGHTTLNLLLDGDLWAVERHAGIYERIGLTHRRLVRTGYAVRYEVHPQYGGPYYEHGGTLAACREEYQRKATLHPARLAQHQADQRTRRMARLIARRCGAMAITYADARQVGYCDAGIRAFCARHGLDPDGHTTLAQLRSTGDARCDKVIAAVALRVALRRAVHA